MSTIDRRTLLQTSIASAIPAAAGAAALPHRMIDTNVSLFQWPFRRLALDDPHMLANKLNDHGIDQAWTGSYEGLLHRDISGVNARLADACRMHPVFTPIGEINLSMPDWKEDLRRCKEDHNMPGIRLHPNYHDYQLGDPRFRQLLELATERGLFVQIAAAIEDVRTQHPRVRAEDVDLAPLPKIAEAVPKSRIQILNWKARGSLVEALGNAPGIYFDTARIEATDGIAKFMRAIPEGRVLFGSHTPFLIFESALIKVAENQLSADEQQSLFDTNPTQLLANHA